MQSCHRTASSDVAAMRLGRCAVVCCACGLLSLACCMPWRLKQVRDTLLGSLKLPGGDLCSISWDLSKPNCELDGRKIISSNMFVDKDVSACSTSRGAIFMRLALSAGCAEACAAPAA